MLFVLHTRRPNKIRSNRFRAFIKGENDFLTQDSDFEYEYNPRIRRPRKEFLLDEISCLEETLAKRRAELREADELLNDCREDLKDAREEVTNEVALQEIIYSSHLSETWTNSRIVVAVKYTTEIKIIDEKYAIHFSVIQHLSLASIRLTRRPTPHN